jgi:Asp-tRNA(Asn)/Glu-tRNA(Gln) amidotransferase A subunit family amidase
MSIRTGQQCSKWGWRILNLVMKIMIGTYALSAGYYDAYYLKAQKTRHLISNDFKEAFKKVDVIMGDT